jgi:hypothetical protein
VGLILSGIPSRAVAIIGVFADGVNFWFFAESNHRPFGSRLSQEPAINPPLAISAIIRMLHALGVGATLVCFIPPRWSAARRCVHGGLDWR